MSTFPRVYAIGSSMLLVLMPVICPFFGFQANPPLSGVLALAWVLWNLYALTRFQSTRVPLTVPMFCPVMIAVTFQFVVLGTVSAEPWSKIFFGLGVGFFVVLALVYLLLTKQLLLCGTAPVVASPPVQPLNARQYGLPQRFLAGLIDGGFLGLCGAGLFFFMLLASATVSAAAHHNIGGILQHANQALRLMLPGLASGFGMGLLCPLACCTNLLCCLAGISKTVGLAGTERLNMLAAILTMLVINIIGLAYYTLMESSRYQATIGKALMGLKVTTESGARLSKLAALTRCAGKLVSFGALCLGFVYIGMSPNRQGFHDILAKCLVVQK